MNPALKQAAERMRDDVKSKLWGDGMMALMKDEFDVTRGNAQLLANAEESLANAKRSLRLANWGIVVACVVLAGNLAILVYRLAVLP